MNIGKIGAKRLERVLGNDKKLNQAKLSILLRSELKNLLENYLDVENFSLDFDIQDGVYHLFFHAKARYFKAINSIE